jgi:hypothetical protein
LIVTAVKQDASSTSNRTCGDGSAIGVADGCGGGTVPCSAWAAAAGGLNVRSNVPAAAAAAAQIAAIAARQESCLMPVVVAQQGLAQTIAVDAACSVLLESPSGSQSAMEQRPTTAAAAEEGYEGGSQVVPGTPEDAYLQDCVPDSDGGAPPQLPHDCVSLQQTCQLVQQQQQQQQQQEDMQAVQFWGPHQQHQPLDFAFPASVANVSVTPTLGHRSFSRVEALTAAAPAAHLSASSAPPQLPTVFQDAADCSNAMTHSQQQQQQRRQGNMLERAGLMTPGAACSTVPISRPADAACVDNTVGAAVVAGPTPATAMSAATHSSTGGVSPSDDALCALLDSLDRKQVRAATAAQPAAAAAAMAVTGVGLAGAAAGVTTAPGLQAKAALFARAPAGADTPAQFMKLGFTSCMPVAAAAAAAAAATVEAEPAVAAASRGGRKLINYLEKVERWLDQQSSPGGLPDKQHGHQQLQQQQPHQPHQHDQQEQEQVVQQQFDTLQQGCTGGPPEQPAQMPAVSSWAAGPTDTTGQMQALPAQQQQQQQQPCPEQRSPVVHPRPAASSPAAAHRSSHFKPLPMLKSVVAICRAAAPGPASIPTAAQACPADWQASTKQQIQQPQQPQQPQQQQQHRQQQQQQQQQQTPGLTPSGLSDPSAGHSGSKPGSAGSLTPTTLAALEVVEANYLQQQQQQLCQAAALLEALPQGSCTAGAALAGPGGASAVATAAADNAAAMTEPLAAQASTAGISTGQAPGPPSLLDAVAGGPAGATADPAAVLHWQQGQPLPLPQVVQQPPQQQQQGGMPAWHRITDQQQQQRGATITADTGLVLQSPMPAKVLFAEQQQQQQQLLLQHKQEQQLDFDQQHVSCQQPAQHLDQSVQNWQALPDKQHPPKQQQQQHADTAGTRVGTAAGTAALAAAAAAAAAVTRNSTPSVAVLEAPDLLFGVDDCSKQHVEGPAAQQPGPSATAALVGGGCAAEAAAVHRSDGITSSCAAALWHGSDSGRRPAPSHATEVAARTGPSFSHADQPAMPQAEQMTAAVCDQPADAAAAEVDDVLDEVGEDSESDDDGMGCAYGVYSQAAAVARMMRVSRRIQEYHRLSQLTQQAQQQQQQHWRQQVDDMELDDPGSDRGAGPASPAAQQHPPVVAAAPEAAAPEADTQAMPSSASLAEASTVSSKAALKRGCAEVSVDAAGLLQYLQHDSTTLIRALHQQRLAR